jgi:hypothetical protein
MQHHMMEVSLASTQKNSRYYNHGMGGWEKERKKENNKLELP